MEARVIHRQPQGAGIFLKHVGILSTQVLTSTLCFPLSFWTGHRSQTGKITKVKVQHQECYNLPLLMRFFRKGEKSFLTVQALRVKFMGKPLPSCMAGQVVQKVSKIQGPQRTWDGKSEMNMDMDCRKVVPRKCNIPDQFLLLSVKTNLNRHRHSVSHKAVVQAMIHLHCFCWGYSKPKQ